MAKAKKQESAAEPAKKKSPATAKKDAPKTAPKAAAKAAPAAKKSTAAAGGGGGAAKKGAKAGGKSPGGTPQVPLIDTGLAAQTAAAMVASGLTGGDAPAAAADAPANRPESSTFKNLKQGLNKPSAGSLGGILGTGGGSKKFSPGFGTQKQGGPATRRAQPDLRRRRQPRRRPPPHRRGLNDGGNDVKDPAAPLRYAAA